MLRKQCRTLRETDASANAPHPARFSTPYIAHSRARPASSHLCARARRHCLSAPFRARTVAALAACPGLRCTGQCSKFLGCVRCREPSEIGNSSFMGPQIYQRDPYRSVLACLDATSRKISTFMSARNPCLMALAAGKGTSLSVCRCVFRLGAVGSVYGAAPAADSVELRRRATPCALSRLRCNTGTIICEHVTCAAPFWEGARLQPHRAMSPQRAGCGALAN
jgi:hypothetical protein